MFDDTIIKNMDNPANYSNTNKLLWTNSSKSNLSDLSGLTNLNSTIKKSVKYVYLNNNNFSNIDVLENFENIVELQLICNPNLSNIDGIKSHTTINYLTLHNCGLTSISGLTGCSELTKLSLQNNSLLTSLTGIENSTNLMYLVAKNCNLTDISSLANHSKVSYLNLANNVNLESVKYIQHCKALNYIYLDSNEKMSTVEVDNAFNGTDFNLGTSVLISKCINSYKNIPKKYWDLFTTTATVLDYSYETLGEYLTDDSPKWIKLKNRKNILSLNLQNQVNLSQNTLEEILPTLTGLKALSLHNVNNIKNLDFLKYNEDVGTPNMKELVELDIRGIDKNVTNLSVLNNYKNVSRLIVDNYDIDFSTIQDLISRMKGITLKESCFSSSSRACSGLVLMNDVSKYDFSDCKRITYFESQCEYFASSQETGIGVLDLSSCTSLKKIFILTVKFGIKFPSSISYCNIDTSIAMYPYDFSNIKSDGTFELRVFGLNQDKYEIIWKSLKGKSILGFKSSYYCGGPALKCLSENIDSMEYMHVSWGNADFEKCFSEMNYIKELSELKCEYTSVSELDLSKQKDLKKVTIDFGSMKNLNGFIGLTNITDMSITNNEITDITGISQIITINSLNLSNNKISNINALANFENLIYVNLSNNNITDLTPLVQAIGDDNKIGYTSLNISNNSLDGYSIADNITALLKLHAAGLTKVYITGNNFSENEVNELINGKTIDGITYSGFGSGNVIN